MTVILAHLSTRPRGSGTPSAGNATTLPQHGVERTDR